MAEKFQWKIKVFTDVSSADVAETNFNAFPGLPIFSDSLLVGVNAVGRGASPLL